MMPSTRTFRLATLNLLTNDSRIEERIGMVVDELRNLKPDAVCLQEVRQFDDLNVVQRIADALGWPGSFSGPTAPDKHNTMLHCTAILSPHSFTHVEPVPLTTGSPIDVVASQARILVDNHHVAVLSSHLAWGSHAEPARQVQALKLDAAAQNIQDEEPGTLILIGGDFNASPSTDTARFFDGHAVLGNQSTLWVDAWTVTGTPENEMTSRNDNEWAWTTARSVGIEHPAMIPERRIDYLKSRGWTYGRAGHPMAFGRWADTEAEDGLSISDHYGIWADFLLV